MSEPIQSISQGNYILQGTVATSAGIIGDGSTQNPLRADETVLWSGSLTLTAGQTSSFNLSESISSFTTIKTYSIPSYGNNGTQTLMVNESSPYLNSNSNTWQFFTELDNPRYHGNNLIQFDMNTLTITENTANYYGYGRAKTSAYATSLERSDRGSQLVKIVGINRISGSNA